MFGGGGTDYLQGPDILGGQICLAADEALGDLLDHLDDIAGNGAFLA